MQTFEATVAQHQISVTIDEAAGLSTARLIVDSKIFDEKVIGAGEILLNAQPEGSDMITVSIIMNTWLSPATITLLHGGITTTLA